MEKIILVFYVGVGNSSGHHIKEMIDQVITMLRKNKDEGIIHYIIPSKEETRIECINPRVISAEEFKSVKEILDRNQKIVDDIVESYGSKD